jgi:hypothetical protein
MICKQGSVSPYYIEIQEPEDVVAEFSYSKNPEPGLQSKTVAMNFPDKILIIDS